MTEQLKNNKNASLPQVDPLVNSPLVAFLPLQCVVLQLSLQNLAVSPLPLYTLLLLTSNARIPSPPRSPRVSVPSGISPHLPGQRPACVHLMSESTSRERTAGSGPRDPQVPPPGHCLTFGTRSCPHPCGWLPGWSSSQARALGFDTLIKINARSTAERLCKLPCSRMIITSTPESCSNTPLIHL